jgi:hypothetical protein
MRSIVETITTAKELTLKHPPLATFREICERCKGLPVAEIQARLDAEVASGAIVRRITINGVAYQPRASTQK